MTRPRLSPFLSEESTRKGAPQREKSALNDSPIASGTQSASVRERAESPAREKKASAEAQSMSTQFTARIEASPYTEQQSASSAAPAERKAL